MPAVPLRLTTYTTSMDGNAQDEAALTTPDLLTPCQQALHGIGQLQTLQAQFRGPPHFPAVSWTPIVLLRIRKVGPPAAKG
jgi:hypothetical protein